MSIEDIKIRNKDLLTRELLKQISENWFVDDEIELNIHQKIELFVMRKLIELEDRIAAIEAKLAATKS